MGFGKYILPEQVINSGEKQVYCVIVLCLFPSQAKRHYFCVCVSFCMRAVCCIRAALSDCVSAALPSLCGTVLLSQHIRAEPLW